MVESGPDGPATYMNAEFVERLASCRSPIQPGTTWDYSSSTDVLGRVVEVVEGRAAAGMKQRLFEPLGMKESSFYVTDKAKHARIAEPFPNDRRSAPASSSTTAQSSKGSRRRRNDVNGDGLCPLRADAAQRRHARWQAPLSRKPKATWRRITRRRDHPGPYYSARPRLRIWPWLCCAAREWRGTRSQDQLATTSGGRAGEEILWGRDLEEDMFVVWTTQLAQAWGGRIVAWGGETWAHAVVER